MTEGNNSNKVHAQMTLYIHASPYTSTVQYTLYIVHDIIHTSFFSLIMRTCIYSVFVLFANVYHCSSISSIHVLLLIHTRHVQCTGTHTHTRHVQCTGTHTHTSCTMYRYSHTHVMYNVQVLTHTRHVQCTGIHTHTSCTMYRYSHTHTSYTMYRYSHTHVMYNVQVLAHTHTHTSCTMYR